MNIQLCQKGLKIFQLLGNSRWIASTLDDLGYAYWLVGDWLAARDQVDVAALLRSLASPAESIEPALFLNGVSGLGSPFWLTDFESRFIGEGTIEARALSVLESIAFLTRVNLDELALHGPALRRIVLSGGIATNDFFCQRLADLAELEVWRSPNRRQPRAGSRGSWPMRRTAGARRAAIAFNRGRMRLLCSATHGGAPK